MHTLMENGDLVHDSELKEYLRAKRIEEMPSEPVVEYHKNREDPVFTPQMFPPRPRTRTVIGGFTPRFQVHSHWFDGRSFLLGVLMSAPLVLFFGIVLIAIIA